MPVYSATEMNAKGTSLMKGRVEYFRTHVPLELFNFDAPAKGLLYHRNFSVTADECIIFKVLCGPMTDTRRLVCSLSGG